MLELLVVVFACTTALAGVGLATALAMLRKRNQQLLAAYKSLQEVGEARRALTSCSEHDAYSAISGMRIALAIRQDHTIPTFSLLLKDALAARGGDVTLMDAEHGADMANAWDAADPANLPDVLIHGSLVCNGYSELYYKVVLNYATPSGALNPTSEAPAQGSPQSSLVITVVSKLEHDLEIAQRRFERSRAMRELRSIEFLLARDLNASIAQVKPGSDVYLDIALSYQGLGDYREAIRAIVHAEAFEQGSPEYPVWIADDYHRMHRDDIAKVYWKMALNRSGSSSDQDWWWHKGAEEGPAAFGDTRSMKALDEAIGAGQR